MRTKIGKKIVWAEKIGNMIVNAIDEGKDTEFILQLTRTLVDACRDDLKEVQQ